MYREMKWVCTGWKEEREGVGRNDGQVRLIRCLLLRFLTLVFFFACNFFFFFYRAKHKTLVYTSSMLYVPTPGRDLCFQLRMASVNDGGDIFERRRGLATCVTPVATPISRRCDAQPRQIERTYTYLELEGYTVTIIQIKQKKNRNRQASSSSSLASATSLPSFSFSSRSFASLLTRSQCSCRTLSCLSNASNSFTSFFSSSASRCCSCNFSASFKASW